MNAELASRFALRGPLAHALVGQKIGFVRVEKPFTERQGEEYAAWWSNVQATPGDYDLTLQADNIYPNQLNAAATIPGTITDNYHASHFGGVAFGKSPDYKGQARNIRLGRPFAEAAANKAANLPEGVTLHVAIDALPAAIEYAETNLRHNIARFPEWADAYHYQPRNPHNSNISMVAACGGWIKQWGDLLNEIIRQHEGRSGWLNQYEKRQAA